MISRGLLLTAFAFWNVDERRLRAVWRLMVQGLLFLLLMVALTIAGMLVVIFLSGAIGVSLPDPMDSNFARSITEFTEGNPLVNGLFLAAPLLGILASVWLAGRFLDRRPFSDFGFHVDGRWWADLGFGLALGAALMAGVFLVELALGWVTITGIFQSVRGSFGAAILMLLLTFIAVGIQEEVLSRGYHLRNMAEGLSFINPRAALWLGYLGSSAIFGLLHIFNPNTTAVSTVNVIVAGLFLGLGFVLTGELGIPIGLHITWNFFQGGVFGFPVSGLASSASFIAIHQGGPDLWTGGPFGPEAGLLGLAATVVGGLLTLAWVQRRYGRAELRDSLALYGRRAGSTPGADAAEVS